MTKKYYSVSPVSFVLLSIFTLGIYEIYWAYKNWVYIKERDQSSIWPFWRAIFAPIWYYSLLSDLAKHSSTASTKSAITRLFLAVSYFITSALWKLDDPYWLLSFLSFFPLLPAVLSIPMSKDPKVNKSHLMFWGMPAFLLGLPIFIFSVLSSINYFPSTSIISGNKMWDKDIEFLRKEKLLKNDEEIIYFYSAGLLSIAEDGQFISNCCIVSYSQNTEDSTLSGYYAYYENIKDISVTWSSSPVDDTVVTIYENDGSEFEAWLSSENKGDKIFVEELKKRWKASKNSDQT
ncbi:DUF4234 domain-containing protein [Spartinivicinus poritis]|uniref:DUF4234 domain-containing protein n=1 Tax=Spartinivicinus poritis TaxID=2994640 RepID=A0ABT5UI22_9GAMM|nr:DUF4234 domain-containing protein [Spartinivicinus sp. A2-2]MDE1466045.1 DUF4234 domain-containing protein [Spartinivicinus sp. A2-2]